MTEVEERRRSRARDRARMQVDGNLLKEQVDSEVL